MSYKKVNYRMSLQNRMMFRVDLHTTDFTVAKKAMVEYAEKEDISGVRLCRDRDTNCFMLECSKITNPNFTKGE